MTNLKKKRLYVCVYVSISQSLPTHSHKLEGYVSEILTGLLIVTQSLPTHSHKLEGYVSEILTGLLIANSY